ncbi:MAG TPA: NADH-quinone oxidoreductase subunit F, partial [Frankiaceae bacterium]|nr:NADH-quinone oxidoreductase subunit F [Frankiaceae bacterium]
MEQDLHRVLEGLALAGLACGAEHGFVYVRAEYPRAGERLRAAVAEAGAVGLLGPDVLGSGVAFDVEVVAGAGSYVAGEETSLLASLEGQRGAPRPRPPYPTSAGLLGRPTAVNNVETLAAVPEIVRRGGHAFAGLGVRPESGTKLVCLNERFRRRRCTRWRWECRCGPSSRTSAAACGTGIACGRCRSAGRWAVSSPPTTWMCRCSMRP